MPHVADQVRYPAILVISRSQCVPGSFGRREADRLHAPQLRPTCGVCGWWRIETFMPDNLLQDLKVVRVKDALVYRESPLGKNKG